MPCEEQICVPVAQNCRASNILVKGIGVKIFEELAGESDREHKIDSVGTGLSLSRVVPRILVRPSCLNLSPGEEKRDDFFCGSLRLVECSELSRALFQHNLIGESDAAID
jgi:hypothetical protein